MGIALLLVLTITSCGDDGSSKTKKNKAEYFESQPKVTMPIYRALDEDIYDAPIKTQVTLKILVSGEISKPGLEVLLNKIYSSIKERKGFKYHNSPTNIYIYAFTSKERAESDMGQWIAMLQSDSDVKPVISTNEWQITQIGVKPDKKLGLSEAKRKLIWNEIVKAEDRAYDDAQQKYPLPEASNPSYSPTVAREQLRKQAELKETLTGKYKNTGKEIWPYAQAA